MKTCSLRTCAVRAVVAVSAALVLAAPAFAARVGLLTNKYGVQTAADFNSRIPTHTFTPIDTATTIPTLQSLTDAFDVILVFEDSTFGNATAIGNVAAAFANTGRAVVIGAFYDQDRSDGPPANSPHGWGALEQLDPNTTDGTGTPYAPRTLDTATMARHPLTGGLTSLTSAKFAGGNSAKPGTTVVAWWKEPNALGEPDPAIAYRITGPACVIQVTIAPNYPSTRRKYRLLGRFPPRVEERVRLRRQRVHRDDRRGHDVRPGDDPDAVAMGPAAHDPADRRGCRAPAAPDRPVSASRAAPSYAAVRPHPLRQCALPSSRRRVTPGAAGSNSHTAPSIRRCSCRWVPTGP